MTRRVEYDEDGNSRKSDLIEIAAELKGETAKAFRIYDGSVTEWVPKSQCQNNGDGTFTRPEGPAIEKGFV